MRVGWAAGTRELIAALNKVKDSYNVNRLSQLGAEATLDDWEYFQGNVKKICATRRRVIGKLEEWRFFVYPSHTNFVFARPPAPLTARQWFEQLRVRNILIRWWDADRIRNFARVSIGTDEEMEKFLEATQQFLSPQGRG